MLVRQMKDNKRISIPHRAEPQTVTPTNVILKWVAIVTLAIVVLVSMWVAFDMVQINRALPAIAATVQAQQNATLAAQYHK